MYKLHELVQMREERGQAVAQKANACVEIKIRGWGRESLFSDSYCNFYCSGIAHLCNLDLGCVG